MTVATLGSADASTVGVGEGLPSRAEFLRIIEAEDGKASGLLRVLLARCKPEATQPEHLLAIEQLGQFVVSGPAVPELKEPKEPGAVAVRPPALVRLEWLVRALERLPAARERFQISLHAVLSSTRAIKLLGEIGLPNDRGLLAETTDRLARSLLPEAPAPHELWRLASRIFRTSKDLEWLIPEADELLHRLADAGGQAWQPMRGSVYDAIAMIATRISALGMGEAFRAHEITNTVCRSPLYKLSQAAPAEMPPIIDAARQHLDLVRDALEQHGVSIEVVYALDSIERGLERIQLLLPFVDASDDLEPTHELRDLLAATGRGLVGDRSFRQLLSDNLRLLARKVIERAGQSGEHYVTSSRREYWKMLGSAAGGGVLTCGTAMARFLVKWGHFPLFIDGLMSSIVYAGSFLVMQLLGFTLATKQPSMTAAALAGSISERRDGHQLDDLVPLIARIARSQFAAAMGNISAVIVTAAAVDLLWQQLRGHPFLDAKSAHAVVASFDPLHSGTIFFAAITGGLLWVSSLMAGWFENWVVYRRLPEAIEHHPMGKRVGKARMAKAARFLEREAAGFGGSIALGFLLGMVPVFAKFIGLPIDVRHVTLSTGSLTFAISSVGLDAIGWGPVLAAAIGIAIIGLLNFGVSFVLALVVALRARDVTRGESAALPGAVFRRFVRRPFEFFYPPREPATRPVMGPPGAAPDERVDVAEGPERVERVERVERADRAERVDSIASAGRIVPPAAE
jgi:site-specific recombinase